MPLDRLLEEATSPADAAEAAQLMAAATVDDNGATEQQRSDARDILALSWEQLISRFAATPTAGQSPPSAPTHDDDDVWSEAVPDGASPIDEDDTDDYDASIISNNANGSTTTINADGSITTVYADGAKGTLWVPQGQTVRGPFGRDSWDTEIPKLFTLEPVHPIETRSSISAGAQSGQTIYEGVKKQTAFVVRAPDARLSAAEIQQIEASMPDGVEVVFVDNVPVRSDDSEGA